MKRADMKVTAIIVSIALFFTIITSNAVSVASLVMLSKGGNAADTGTGLGTGTGTGAGTGTGVGSGTVDPSVDDGTGSGTGTGTGSGTGTGTGTGAGTGLGTGTDSGTGSGAGSGTGSDSGGGSGSSSKTWDKATSFNFYKKYAHAFKVAGNATYIKKEWQSLSNLNLTGSATIDNAILSRAGGLMVTEETCEPQVSEKGSEEAKSRFPDCTLTDLSKVVSATKTDLANGNIKITIVMADEDTPKKSGSSLGQVTNAILYWEDISEEVDKIGVVSGDGGSASFFYKGFMIEAEMTKDGKFISIAHTAKIDITVNGLKLLGFSLDGKGAHLDNYFTYTDFKY